MGWTGGRKKPQPWERLLTVVSCLLQGQSLLSVIMLYDLHYRQAGLWLFFLWSLVGTAVLATAGSVTETY